MRASGPPAVYDAFLSHWGARKFMPSERPLTMLKHNRWGRHWLLAFIAAYSAPALPCASVGSSCSHALAADIQLSRYLHVDASALPGGDGSVGAPLPTIQAALARSGPGTRIVIAPGTYGTAGSATNLQGTAEHPIVIIGDGKVVIDAQGSSSGLHLVDPAYVVIEGIAVRNAVPHGISIDDGSTYDSPAHDIVLRNVTFSNIGNGGNNDCLKLSGVDDFRVENSHFSGCDRGEAIDMVGCHRGVITGSTFSDMPGVAVQAKGGSADVLIRGNRFSRIGQRAVNAGGMTGTPWFRPLAAKFEAEDIRILSNVIEDIGSAPVVFSGCNDCVFANNTVVNPGDYVARIVQENRERDAGGNGYFINNVILFDPGDLRDYVDVRPGTRSSTFTFGWNLWHATGRRSFSGPEYGGGLPPERKPVNTANPRLDGTLRPLPGSPALAAGRTVPGGLSTDFDRREYGTPPAIGAFAGPRERPPASPPSTAN